MNCVSSSGDACSKRPPCPDSKNSNDTEGDEESGQSVESACTRDVFKDLLAEKENTEVINNCDGIRRPTALAKRRSEEYELPNSQDESPLKCYKSFKLATKNDNVRQNKTEVSDTESRADEVTNPDTVKPVFKSNAKKPVVFICSEELVQRCDQMIKVPKRASMVASLIKSYGLMKYMRVEAPRPASLEELSVFHCQDYLTFLQQISTQEDDEKYDDEAQQYGLSYDCPAHLGVFDYTALVCGGTLQAAQSLMDGVCDVAVNWFGGWHHGKRDAASGFCYTNDIVLGILKLREKFTRVLYVDLDLHHGDGVEDAFSTTNKVMTVSVHKYTVGFFPGTGSVEDMGYGKGKNHAINIPLRDGIKDAEFAFLVCRVLLKVREKFQPEAIVCQCGADGLTGDPMESFNLTPLSLGKCVYTLLSWKLPLLLLGGGGYHHGNTARCWAYLTGVVLGKRLPVDIPEHQFLMEYGPDYELSVSPGNMRDQNSREYLQDIFSRVMYNLNQMT